MSTLQELKQELAAHLRAADRLKKPEGIPTGVEAIDSYLLWQGFPKGSLSLVKGELGTGSTSLWIGAAESAIGQNKWVAWINSEVPLFPLPLRQRQLDLSRLVAVEMPEDDEKLFWLLQELMSSSLFEVIGCDLGPRLLKNHQVRKLQTQARALNIALIFLSQRPQSFALSLFALIVHFQKRQIVIERALHRPTPHVLPRRISYASFTLHSRDRLILSCGGLSSSRLNNSSGDKSNNSHRSQQEPRALLAPQRVTQEEQGGGE